MIKINKLDLNTFILIFNLFIIMMRKFFNFKSSLLFSQIKGTTKRVRLGRTGTSLRMGFLGMANIGKSSTFNLLSNLNVPA